MPDPKTPKVIIVDFGLGNLFSVKKACEHAGIDAVISADKELIASSEGMILPGVGAFGDAMDNIIKLDLVHAILNHIESNKPFMGICLGMQLLLSESEEFGNNKGLNVFKGRVHKFPRLNGLSEKIKIPQVGWNRINISDGGQNKWQGSLLKGIEEGECMYFVHSFFADPDDKDIELTTTNYEGIKYCSSVSKGNIFASQFHPEKSGERGLTIYKNFTDKIIQTRR